MLSSSGERDICAVVVTFNRKQVLARCIGSILSGDLVPARILVVDNASTDGTEQFIAENFPEAVSVLRLPRNVGGAGGFKAGMAAAAREGYRFLWVMDDDHEIESGTLRVMYDAMERSGSDVVGPVMLTPERNGKLCWAMGPGGQGYLDYECLVRDYGEDGLVPQVPAPFNAVLYRTEVLNLIGLPDERLFIRGDEIEYGYRIEHLRVKSVVEVAARVYHPPTAHQNYRVLSFGQLALTAPYTSDKLKDYCMSRNRAFYFKKYGIYKSLVLDLVRFPMFFLVNRRLDLNGFGLWSKAYIHGLLGRFGYERRFLVS